MSGLSTDIFFIAAIKSNETLMARLPAGDIYNNVANPDFDMENVQIPYIIVNNDGGRNGTGTKDETYEADEDSVMVSIRMVARNRKELDDIANEVRETILGYIREMDESIDEGEEPEGWQLKPSQYEFSFSDIANDMMKPSFTIMFYYQCDVGNHTEDDEDDGE